ncbi:hypothetical protein IU469_37075, partial [Nocardia puris]
RFVHLGPDDRAQLVVVANGLVLDDHSWRVIVDQLGAAWSRRRYAAAVTGTGLAGLLRELAARAADPAVHAELGWWRAMGADSGRIPPGADLSVRSRVSL